MITHDVLALDLGHSTGWAHSSVGSGTVHFPHATRGQFLSHLAQWIRDKHRHNPIRQIVFEDAFYGARNAAVKQFHSAAAGVVHLVSHEIEAAPPVAYSIPTVKKWATGHRRASKADMIQAVRQRLRLVPKTHHEADAVWMLHMARQGVTTSRDAADHPASWAGQQCEPKKQEHPF